MSCALGPLRPGPKFKNHRIQWFTDNHNVARIVLFESKRPILHEEAIATLYLLTHP